MAESFECPECGKVYPRQNRLVGKAVACECGRRFLVPPPEAPAPPPSASPPPMAKPVSAARPAPPGARLPGIGTPLKAAAPPMAKPARWADPVPSNAPVVPNDPIPLTEADLVEEPGQSYSAAAYGPLAAVPISPAQYAGGGMPLGQPLPPSRYQPPAVKKPKKKRRQSNQDSAATIGRYVAFFVLFGLIPLGGLLFLMSIIMYSKYGWH